MNTTSNTQHKEKEWDWSKRKPNNMVVINAGPTTGFFKWWCIYMRPMVKLTDKEVDLIACFLKHRWELSKVIPDPEIVDSQLMSKKTIAKILKECNITRQHFYVIRSELKKNNILTPTGINSKLIPNIRQNEDGTFQFLILFKEKKKDDV